MERHWTRGVIGSVLACAWCLALGPATGGAAEGTGAGTGVGTGTEDGKLASFYRERLEALFDLRPSLGTTLGARRCDGKLEDLDPQSRARWTRQARETLALLPTRIDYGRLTRQGQVDFEIWRHDLRTGLWLDENFDPFATDPRVYGDYLSGGVFTVLTQSSAPRETNIANAISRIRLAPRVVEAARASLKRPPRAHTETAIRQNQGAIAFFETAIFELAGQTPRLPELKAAVAALLPALRGYQEFLEKELLPRADGEWRVGRRKFARKFALETDAGLTADEIYADARREFERVRNDMYVLARQAWSRYLPGEALPPDDPEGRRATVERVLGRVAQEHGRPEDIVADARGTVDRIRTFIRDRDILRLPEPDLCEVIEMPEFQRGNSTAYMNSPPPLDGEAKGYYAVSPPPASWDARRVKSYLEEYNRHMLQVLTIHEAYPGHYVQLEYANRNPSLIRKVLGSGVYIEGWAVYTEQMLLDQGYGDGEVALRLNQLKFYLRAVANTLLDHRMHCEGLSDEEAMDLLVRQAFQSEGEARLKVIRSKQSSVQLSTYFTGRMAHYRLRQEVQRDLGDRFALGRYHEAVLENGSVPVKYLRELVRTRLGLAPDRP